MNDTTSELSNHVTVEIMGLAPRLRSDLKISVQSYAGQTCYLIEDPISSRFSRVGLAEYTLMSLLDGQTTIAEAIGQAAAVMGPDALSEQEAAALCKWLIESQLAETEQSRGAARLVESAGRSRHQKAVLRLNPIFQQVPLLNPSPVLRHVVPWVGWIFSGPAVFLWLAAVGCGAYGVGSRWDKFTSDTGVILARGNWIWLLLTWLVLKLVHEAGHALACQRCGATVREAGVMFILFAPLPYVDVTSSWRFDSKWKRMFTAAAGMYVELFVAGVAAIVWSMADSPLLQQHARNVIVTATVVTALFNLNPLMRFDGYYMLCDWLELPNLATHGRQLLSYFGRRYGLGAAVQRPDWPEGRTAVVAIYGLAALLWRICVCVALVIAAEAMFWRAGVVLAFAAAAVWLVVPAVRLIGEMARPGRVNRRRIGVVATLAGGSLAGLWCLPWYSIVTAPVVVDHETVRDVRSPVGGFVRQVLVEEGDEVEAGQLLAVLENRELELDVERLQIEIEQSAQRSRRVRQAHEIAAFQMEAENRRALETRLEDLLARLAHLQVRAPIAGTVTRADLKQLLGMLIRPGDVVLRIGARGDMQLHALISQRDAAVLATNQSRKAEVHIWGTDRRWDSVQFERVHPRATTRLVHPGFGAHAGGPLAVRPGADRQDRSDRWELVEPAVLAKSSCGTWGTAVLPGQMGVVRFTHYRGRLGDVIFGALLRWMRNRREAAAAA